MDNWSRGRYGRTEIVPGAWPFVVKIFTFSFFVWCLLVLVALVGGPVLFFVVAPATNWAAGREAVENHGLRQQLVAGLAFVSGVPVAAGEFWARGRRRLVHIDEEGVWWVAPVLRARLRALMLLCLLLAVEWGVLGFGWWVAPMLKGRLRAVVVLLVLLFVELGVLG
ncbi:hypothetical protein IWZ01DRAFT_132748 [Phyllosticta capitalensis]